MMTKLQTKRVQARIKRGLAWLKKNQPNFRNKISIQKLQMDNANQCMLGFSFGNYWKVVKGSVLTNPDPRFGFSEQWAVAHGFMSPTLNGDNQKRSDYFEALDREWRKVLLRLKRK